MDDLIINNATNEDLSFVIDCIIGAEYSGSEILSYCALLQISEAEFRKVLINIFEEEIEGQPWNLKHWLVGKVNHEPVVGGCCWIEASTGMSSDMLKSQILQYFLPNHWQNNLDNLKLTAELSLARIPQSVQVEYFYTHPNHRKKGYITRMIYFIDSIFPNHDREIVMVGNNVGAMELYKRHGYKVIEIKSSTEKKILTLLPSNTKIALLKSHD